jgi:transcription antitermination factor NusG
MTWYVIGVRSGLEFRIEDNLQRRDIPALVPRRFVARRARGRLSHAELPVIASYVFARIDSWHWPALWQIEGWRGPRRIGDRLMTLTASEYDVVAAMSQPAPSHPDMQTYKPGDRVRVSLNHMATLKGLVRRIERGHVVVEVEMLGKLHELAADKKIVEAA